MFLFFVTDMYNTKPKTFKPSISDLYGMSLGMFSYLGNIEIHVAKI